MAIKCEYGCNQEAKYQFKNGKWCCSPKYHLCIGARKKNSESLKGRKLSNSHKQAIGKGNKGKKVSLETGKKISESKKNKERKDMIGCNNPKWKGGYRKKNIPLYDTYAEQIMYAEPVRRSPHDKNVLEVKCTYCGKWYIPKMTEIQSRILALNGNINGEFRLYCSSSCKKECPIYKQRKYPKGYKKASSREVQPELRQMVFERDEYQCQKCKSTKSLHCHHIEGIRWEPLESADIDKCITLCKKCHKVIHKKEECRYIDMQCK